eukprot:10801711-Alexandrium_andersonii.AAC.1
MSASLVGSEMCIRDRTSSPWTAAPPTPPATTATATMRNADEKKPEDGAPAAATPQTGPEEGTCLLYTSDAADDM